MLSTVYKHVLFTGVDKAYATAVSFNGCFNGYLLSFVDQLFFCKTVYNDFIQYKGALFNNYSTLLQYVVGTCVSLKLSNKVKFWQK